MSIISATMRPSGVITHPINRISQFKHRDCGISIETKRYQTYLIKLLPEAHRFGDSVGDLLSDLLLLCDVLHEIIHLIDVPGATGRRGDPVTLTGRPQRKH